MILEIKSLYYTNVLRKWYGSALHAYGLGPPSGGWHFRFHQRLNFHVSLDRLLRRGA
jgi:hypothetical protein